MTQFHFSATDDDLKDIITKCIDPSIINKETIVNTLHSILVTDNTKAIRFFHAYYGLFKKHVYPVGTNVLLNPSDLQYYWKLDKALSEEQGYMRNGNVLGTIISHVHYDLMMYNVKYTFVSSDNTLSSYACAVPSSSIVLNREMALPAPINLGDFL
jgi:hypothetical protein